MLQEPHLESLWESTKVWRNILNNFVLIEIVVKGTNESTLEEIYHYLYCSKESVCMCTITCCKEDTTVTSNQIMLGKFKPMVRIKHKNLLLFIKL